MAETNTRLTIATITTIVCVSLLLPAVGPAAGAEDPETADEYFDTLQEMEDLAIYEEYEELETLQTQSFAAVQVGEFTDEEAEELDSVITTIRLFEDAQARFENREYDSSFETAAQIEDQIAELESQDEPLGALSRLALTRYYEQLGDELATEAEAVDHTPTEIELREMAATAYRKGNSPDQAAEFTRQVEQLEAELTADREQMDAAEAAMNSLDSSCSACQTPVDALSEHDIGVVQRYTTALRVEPMLADATQRADRHGLDERNATLAERTGTAGTMRDALAVASTVILVGYGVVVGLVVGLVAARLFAWKRTYEAAQVDSVVVMGDSDV